MPRVPLFRNAAVGLLVAAVLTGCTGPAVVTPAATPTPSVTTPTPTSPPSLADDDLYALAVSQYEKLHAIFADVDSHGGAPSLPDSSHEVMMSPAWGAYDQAYRDVLLRGEKLIGDPQYTISKMERLYGEGPIGGAVVALQTCEVFQGASVVDRDGNIINDGTPSITHMNAYLKYDETDWQLKVFVLDGEVVDTCPF